MMPVSTIMPLVVRRVGVRSSKYFSRIVLIVLQSVDTLSTFVLEPTVYIRGKGIHSRVMRHEATISSTCRAVFSIPYRRHCRRRRTRNANRATKVTLGPRNERFLAPTPPMLEADKHGYSRDNSNNSQHTDHNPNDRARAKMARRITIRFDTCGGRHRHCL